ncbi:MAG: phage Gp37/Gp68 family protein [Chloroflexi bacterium]|nr:phage Gp37/Gp68 family protein [Chloroflexota bacterium]
MAVGSSIEWTESTWNPLTGCTKISPGCKHCYAERMALRLQAMGQPNYANGFKLKLHEHVLELPLRWKKPQVIFVNSMSDLFHKQVPLEYIQKVFEVMNRAHWHTFQVLTKRSARLLERIPHSYVGCRGNPSWLPNRNGRGQAVAPTRIPPINSESALEIQDRLEWTKNVWMGVSVETQNYMFRIDDLGQTGAQTKFLSLEPLLGPLPNLNLKSIDWVIVGGESGPRARPMSEDWVIEIRDQCNRANIPFFFKQWGGVRKKNSGRLLDNRTWDEMPRSFNLGVATA